MTPAGTKDCILSADWLLPVTAPPISEGGVVIVDGKILAIGKGEELSRRFSPLPYRAFPGCILMPGLINAHTHLDLSLFRDRLTLPADFVSWLLELIPLRLQMDARQSGEALRRGAGEAVLSGTTTIGDITRSGESIPILQKIGCRGVLFREVIDRSVHEASAWIEDLKEKISAMKSEAGGKITIGISPHTPYTLSKERMEALAAFLREVPLPCTMHIAESEAERDYFLHHTGELKTRLFPAVGWGKAPDPEEFGTPLEQVRKRRLLDRRLAVIHGVHLTPQDIKHLHRAGSSVILCPRSNDNLRVGRAPIRKLLEAEIPTALGTDSLASNRSLSLWDEMRFLRKRFPHDDLVTPERLIRMATLGGAEALGLSNETGSIEAGKEADIIAVNCRMDEPGRLVSTLIAGTTPGKIRMIMVGGEMLLESSISSS
ncbi:MAG: amidohydrolase family protein [Deltaproteobacteria bacterium]|nr:amidohydrolase family protein [Deltaproteobacteria bacterium]